MHSAGNFVLMIIDQSNLYVAYIGWRDDGLKSVSMTVRDFEFLTFHVS